MAGNNWNNGPFGFDPEDFDRFAREAGEGLREVVGRLFESKGAPAAWSAMFESGFAPRGPRPAPAPETAGETGSGVWAVFVVDEDGGARVEQVFATELDALRANARNTDPQRKVRFLPYGIAVSALDEEDKGKPQPL
ncbi:hypothetical protein GII30_16355 [Gordonia amarae]|uniref:Transmembrane protein n=2 Tax=Gordonia amarae TaxID=36821 RepID=G7GV80_9ACTN|nr:hypothetical protein [Gordonia amarae]MCS3879983.1 hypothetical protein [Gordonia amarae]QHN18374.1 hypothetical protein GII35_16670 [Gordonia amarae]QHN22856.1 hypothetical protein GII34_16210 [Gordonia amarae]QHN31759.1 hypothetical protein GII32_16520 [Gordonia amarae]QHN40505.1 hypothetical protein GII30_16355 [Gordonia amarae]